MRSSSPSSVTSIRPSSGSDGFGAACGRAAAAAGAGSGSTTASERSSSISPSSPITTLPGAEVAAEGTAGAAASSVVSSRKGSSSPAGFSATAGASSGSGVSAASGAGAGRSISTSPAAAAGASSPPSAAGIASSRAAGVSASRAGAASGTGSGSRRGRGASGSGSSNASSWAWCATTLCFTISTIRPPRSTMALPALLTVLMKLRLMNTPVRIHPPASRISMPKAPMRPPSMRATSMPSAPPQPLLEQRLHLSPKAKPSVSDARIMIRKRLRIEWLKSRALRRMIRTPISISITGSRMPGTPKPRPTNNSPRRAPARPQRFSTAPSKRGSSAPTPCNTLWSLLQLMK